MDELKPKQKFDHSDETIQKILSHMSFNHQKLVNEQPVSNSGSFNQSKIIWNAPRMVLDRKALSGQKLMPLKSYTGRLPAIQRFIFYHKKTAKSSSNKANLAHTLSNEKQESSNIETSSVGSSELDLKEDANKTIIVVNII